MLRSILSAAGGLALVSTFASAQEPPGPNAIQARSDIRIEAEFVGTMPFVIGPGLLAGTSGPNLQSPVPIGESLFFIDQNDAIYFARKPGQTPRKIFSIADGDAPEGLLFGIPDLSDGKGGTIDYKQRQAVFNISEGSAEDKFYVMLVAVVGSTLPNVPRYYLPGPQAAPIPCCAFFSPPLGEITDIYNIDPSETAAFPLSFPYPGIEHQALYEFTLRGNKLVDPRPIAIFDSQGGPLHHGSAMLTLKGGKILYATGDAVPFGLSGLEAPQDPLSHLSKLMIVDPDDGSIEIAAYGLRNVQYMEIVKSKDTDEDYLVFGDIGGWTAEEVNVVPLADVLDVSVPENFGWGINMDGKAREGTFYVATEPYANPDGSLNGFGAVAFSLGTPSVEAAAPSPEPGFIQPHAQYERPVRDENGNLIGGDPLGGVAVTGPVTSIGFSDITMLFSDLSSAILYATTDPLDMVDAPVYALPVVDAESGMEYASLLELARAQPGNSKLTRVDPRFFRFPDGDAGVLLEATGAYYKLKDIR